MTAPAAEATKSPLDLARENLANAEAEYQSKKRAVEKTRKLLEKAGEKDIESNEGFQMLSEVLAKAERAFESAKAAVENVERSERTKTVIEPFINAFGTVEVPTSEGIGSIHLADLDAKTNALRDNIKALNSRLIAYEKLAAARIAAGISDEVAAEIQRPITFEAVSPTSVKISVSAGARRGGGGGGGGAGRAKKDEIVIIESAAEPYQSLVGMRIGAGCDYETWRDLYRATNPEKFAELEAKRANGSNFSAAQYAKRHFGLTYRVVKSGADGADN